MIHSPIALAVLLALPCPAPQEPAARADAWIDAHAERLHLVNQTIWSAAEVGLEERESSRTLIEWLEEEGFRVERGVAGMPTAFIAELGSGAPRIGILAEYDALPGMSQAVASERRPREEQGASGAGHACGHSVFGTASTAAAIAAAKAAVAEGLAGSVRLYGTPAEETGIGKVYMARAGLFDDLDCALAWHASSKNRANFASCKAVVSVKWRFAGKAAHASRSPHDGISALDAVELMNAGANFLREHLRDEARIHYVITDGGGQPNVVPPSAEVWYYLRADSHAYVEFMLTRLREIAAGAALMTRATLSEQIDADLFELLPNRPLAELLQGQLERVGVPAFDDAERAFARATQADFGRQPERALADSIEPLPEVPERGPASTDVGNVSWRVPTCELNVACYTWDAPGHSWQIVACTGGSIGEKGMLVAAKALAGATLELLSDPDLRAAARADFEARREAGDVPSSVLAEDAVAPTKIR